MVRHWPRQALVTKMLRPDQSIASGYELWNIRRASGAILQGVIAAETPTTLSLRAMQQETTVLREDIAAIEAVGASAMPAVELSEGDMADLLAFLKGQSH